MSKKRRQEQVFPPRPYVCRLPSVDCRFYRSTRLPIRDLKRLILVARSYKFLGRADRATVTKKTPAPNLPHLIHAYTEKAVPELLPGPVGEYIEVVDVDPASGCVYDPVDLNDPMLLARDGHAPSIGNPQFHQQMVYAVAMKTIANFERILGRRVLWSDRNRLSPGQAAKKNNQFFIPPEQRYVQRLRIYPHALREENAYYSPVKKALLFGYF